MQTRDSKSRKIVIYSKIFHSKNPEISNQRILHSPAKNNSIDSLPWLIKLPLVIQ